jgi:phosphocarrier protein
MKREYTIIDEAGLHARPASLLVQEATKFSNDIYIEYSGKKLTLKSIMAVMSLGVPQGASIGIDVEGDNSMQVFEALEGILKDHRLI